MPNTADKKKRKVQRLVDVEVTHVSLVDRPANMTPFKAIKRDEANPEGAKPMNITLKNMFGSRQPEITSVMAVTQATAIAVAKALMEGEGELTEQDGVFVVRKAGHEADANDKIFHMGTDIGVAYGVSHLKKELALFDMDADNFDDALQQEGFVPGIFIGMDALHTAIRNAAMSDDTDSPEVFKSKVSKEIEAFQKYVDTLIDALPTKAFKFEKALVAIAPNDLAAIKRPEGEGFNSEVYDAIFGTDEAASGDEASTQATESATEGAPSGAEGEGATEAAEATQAGAEGAGETSEASGEQTSPQGGATPEEAKAAPSNLEELPKGTPETQPATQEELLAGVMEGLTKTIGDTVAAAVKPLTERMDASDEAMQKMSKAVGGAVASTPEEDDDNVVQLSKSGMSGVSGGDIPLMDTAYNVHRNKG